MAERRFPGLVLAGGLSRRMGTDKAGLIFGGEPLAHRVVARLSPQVSAVWLNADRLPPGLDLPLVPDADDTKPGPLAGVLAGLRHVARTAAGVTHLLTVPVDSPFFPHDLGTRLAAALDGPDTAAVARSASGLHPVFALWPVRAAGPLADFLANPEQRRVRAFLDRLDSRIVDFDDIPTPLGPVDPFLNLNTPAEAEAALPLLEHLR